MLELLSLKLIFYHGKPFAQNGGFFVIYDSPENHGFEIGVAVCEGGVLPSHSRKQSFRARASVPKITITNCR
jgi:hypothetical protein